MRRIILLIISIVIFVIATINFNFTNLTFLQVVYSIYCLIAMFILPLFIILKMGLFIIEYLKKKHFKILLRILLILIYCGFLLIINPLQYYIFKDLVMYIDAYYIKVVMFSGSFLIFTYKTKWLE